MAPQMLRRESSSAGISGTTSNYIAGFTVAGIVLFGVLIWIIFHQRSRASRRRSDNRGAAFLHVRGVVRPMMEGTNPSSSTLPVAGPPPFTRERLTASVVMPEKALTQKPAPTVTPDRIAIISPSPPSAPLPSRRPHSNISPVSPRTRPMSTLNPAHPRHSRSSSGFSGYSQFRLPPGLHSRESSPTSSTSSQARPVRQLFEPLLPDELPLSRYGEYLTVLQSFDDGWCLVARDPSLSSRASMFVPSRQSARIKGDSEHIELGLVPAWVFVKPLKGLTVTRPMRNASVDAVQMGQDVPPTREAVVSWSHVA